ncbi:phosphodiester glycosidase family protein [Bacillus cereus group sp. BfR-BA-01538]|uniref:phosphodiester glycosidase family protein n=1 Tax=Bacillus cereus group sp. BfR-BA-01538 TaxID=2920373 RepID=UPI001F5982A4
MKKLIKIFSVSMLVSLIFICFILFSTTYGHELRVIAAESILTSQHRDFAKLTLLSQKELDGVLASINNPNWKNSQPLNTAKFSEKKLKEKTNEPLNIKIETIKKDGSTKYFFEGKLMTISNPLNVKLVTQKGSQGENNGEKISVMAQRNHALAAVNASGFPDETGHGGGKVPLGTVIANGQVINTIQNNMDEQSLIAGLTKYGEMITGNYSAKQLLGKQVVSAAGFEPQLIVNGEKMITTGDGGWGYGPRTIMAQKKDGSIMFLVIDGRQPHSIGASLKDCQDLLYDRGAVNALAMDGGSSATLYALGKIQNIPSTLSHKDRFLPNCWIVSANKDQKTDVTIDGKHVVQN